MNNIKKYCKNNKAGKQKRVFLIAFVILALLIVSSLQVVVALVPHPIYGYAVYCNGGNADGAKVYVNASSIGKQKITWVGPTGGWASGYWQVDVGDPDVWPSGTAFTVHIVGQGAHAGWFGSTSGTVSGAANNMGTVTLNPPTLVADADASPTIIVAGETVNFYGSATGGATPYGWSWNFGGDGTSTLQNPTHTFNTPGSYNCVLTVTDACSNSDTDSVTIQVNAALSCEAGGPYSGTICSPVSFSGSGSGGHPPYSYSWTFGDGGTGSGANPTHQYTSDGSYTATLTVTDSHLDTASDTAPVTISTPTLIAEAGGPYTGTICNSISFSGSASGGCIPYSWSWTFGDGGSSTLQNPTHQYTGDGSYTATLTVTDNKGASDSDTASVTVSTPTLVANADGPSTGCTGEPVSFTGSASGGCTPYSWSWGFGDGGNSNQQNPSHSFSNPGVYTVTLTVTDNKGQTDSDSLTITITDCDLDVDAHGPYNGEVGESIQFTGSVSGGSPPYYWQWSFGDGSISDQQNPTHVYTSPSPPSGFPVTLYVSDSTGTSGQDQTRAYITGGLVADANGPYYGEVGVSISFSGSASGGTSPYSFSWDFGDGSTSSVQNPTHSYSVEGEYTVILTVTDDDGKTDSDSTTATIGEDIPVPDLECVGSLSWVNVIQGTTVNGSFIVKNVGDSGSSLNWEISSYPEDWGTWTFTPSEGSGLTPGDGDLTVEVTLVAPKAKGMLFFKLDDTEEFTGDIVVVNKDNSGDSEVITVSITVSKVKVLSLIDIFEYLIYRFPILEKILKILI